MKNVTGMIFNEDFILDNPSPKKKVFSILIINAIVP